MSDVDFEEVREFFNKNGWSITDEWEPGNPSGNWSVTAEAEDSIRVSVDEPSDELVLNNMIVESRPVQTNTVSEYTTAVNIADEISSVWVQVWSEDGTFELASNSTEFEDVSDRELLERLEQKNISFGVKFIVAESTEDTELEQLSEFVKSAHSAISKFNSE